MVNKVPSKPLNNLITPVRIASKTIANYLGVAGKLNIFRNSSYVGYINTHLH